MLNRFQLCDGGDAQRSHCALECMGKMYDEICHELLKRWTDSFIHPYYSSKE